MPFHVDTSNLFVIDDTNFEKYTHDVVDGVVRNRGLIPRDFAAEPYGAATPYSIPMTTKSLTHQEMREIMEEKRKTRSTNRDKRKRAGLGPLNQQTTNFCWQNCVTMAFMVGRVLQGEDHVDLSPASIAAMITNFQNVGGWPTKGLAYLVEHGAVPTSLWPANAIDRRYNNTESKAARGTFKATKWFDIQPGDADALATGLLLYGPGAVALNWWRHAVTFEDPFFDEKGFLCFDALNSWGPWGQFQNGEFVLRGSKSIPSEAVMPTLGVSLGQAA